MRAPLALVGVALFVGHGGQPLDVARPLGQGTTPPAAAAVRADADLDASRFLAAARGAAPVICSLAAAPLGEGWGYGRAPAVTSAAESGLLEWALQPSFSDRDLIVLEEGIRDDDPCVRTMAARLLGSAGTAGLRILSEALSDPVTMVRLAAIEALGRSDHEDSIEALLPMLDSDDARIRAAAARAIGRIL